MICLWPCRSSSRAGCTGASRRLRDGPRPAAGIMSAPVRWLRADDPDDGNGGEPAVAFRCGRPTPTSRTASRSPRRSGPRIFIIAPPPLHGQQPGGRGSQRRLYHGARPAWAATVQSSHRISRAFASRKLKTRALAGCVPAFASTAAQQLADPVAQLRVTMPTPAGAISRGATRNPSRSVHLSPTILLPISRRA